MAWEATAGVRFRNCVHAGARGGWLAIHHRIDRACQNLTAYITMANAKTINAPGVDRKDYTEY